MPKKNTKAQKSNEPDGAEFFAAIGLIEKEKGIPKDYMLEKITQALVSAYKRDHEGVGDNVVVEANEAAGTVRMFVKKDVVETVDNPCTEMSLEEARQKLPQAGLGDVIRIEVRTRDFGRIAAQTARQVIIQGMREAERGMIYDEFSSKEHEILTGVITRVEPVGLGHRVCADTLSLLRRGQGMLVGNSSAFTFLVHAETEHNEYVAARPFRVNAGAVHAYTRLPHDKTTYLGELRAGQEVLIVGADGETSVATLGRVKIEVRPMLLIEARVEYEGGTKTGTIFLQNAETIRLTGPDGTPLSVVGLKPGDTVLCRIDEAGRHFGMRVREEIREV